MEKIKVTKIYKNRKLVKTTKWFKCGCKFVSQSGARGITYLCELKSNSVFNLYKDSDSQTNK